MQSGRVFSHTRHALPGSRIGKATWKTTKADKEGVLKLKGTKATIKKATKPGKHAIIRKAIVKGATN